MQESLPTWENGVFAKILRDAEAAVAAHQLTAVELWASVFNNAELWLNHDDDEELTRPTEYEAIKRVFRSCSGAQTVWARWLDEQDAALYGRELATIKGNIPYIAAETAEEENKARARAERKAIRESQLRLPLGVAA